MLKKREGFNKIIKPNLITILVGLVLAILLIFVPIFPCRFLAPPPGTGYYWTTCTLENSLNIPSIVGGIIPIFQILFYLLVTIVSYLIVSLIYNRIKR